jgi:hypothetical protein
MASPETLKERRAAEGENPFDVFLSYSRRDEKFGERLEAALENYRLPRSVRAKNMRNRLNVFRDRRDLVPNEGDYWKTATAAGSRGAPRICGSLRFHGGRPGVILPQRERRLEGMAWGDGRRSLGKGGRFIRSGSRRFLVASLVLGYARAANLDKLFGPPVVTVGRLRVAPEIEGRYLLHAGYRAIRRAGLLS